MDVYLVVAFVYFVGLIAWFFLNLLFEQDEYRSQDGSHFWIMRLTWVVFMLPFLTASTPFILILMRLLINGNHIH